jgi:hypothetical protein
MGDLRRRQLLRRQLLQRQLLQLSLLQPKIFVTLSIFIFRS